MEMFVLPVNRISNDFNNLSSEFKLQAGSILPATLIELHNDSTAVIQIMGEKLIVKLDADLKIGEKVNLLVTGNLIQGALELKVLASAPKNESTEAHTLVKQLGIPPIPEAFAAIQALEYNPPMHEILLNIKDSIAEIFNNNHTNISDSILLNLKELNEVIEQLLKGNADLSVQLKDKSKLLGLDYEQIVSKFLKHIVEQNTINMQTEKSLKQLLLLLETKTYELKNVGLDALTLNADKLLKHITAQQLITQGGQESSQQNFNYITIPLFKDDSNQTLNFQLVSRQRAGSKKIDPSNCYILLNLNMPNLGALDIHMNVVDKAVSLRLVTEKAKTLINVNYNELIDALNKLGFKLSVFKIEEKSNQLDGLTLLPFVITKNHIDFTV